MTVSKTLPLLPMRDIVVFPHTTTPFFIGRAQSMAALDIALGGDRAVFVTAQKDPMVEKPNAEDLYKVGAIGVVLQIMRLPNGTVKALFEAKGRGSLLKARMNDGAYEAVVEPIVEEFDSDAELSALAKTTMEELEVYLRDIKRNSDSAEQFSLDAEKPEEIADKIAPLLSLSLRKKQELMSIFSPKQRLEKVLERMLEEAEIKKLEKKLKERVQGQIGRTQKEYYLNEQIKAIQKELGASEDGKQEQEEYEKKLKELPLSKEAATAARKEIKKLKMMSSMSAEANVVRNYLDVLLGMPWGQKTKDNFGLNQAEAVLEQDHYGLDKVKERIIEYLAVAKKVGKLSGPIVCLVGPPGVGKTSLAKSVARALGRKFVRMSLGGVRDEAEIRGHRRTYIGAMPGKILQSLRKAKSNNALILLDEVDKMTYGIMGDPAAALLEVLDSEQNHAFMDHYLEVEYDLSDVLFFCTANDAGGIPYALRDRMEMITLAGYTEQEKQHIATKHLALKQIKENGLTDQQVNLKKSAIVEIIERYTREAGVRSLEREIGKVMRKVATRLVKKPQVSKISVSKTHLLKMLGPPRYRHERIVGKNEVGVGTGMAWTAVGGDLLFTEVSLMRGEGRVQVTGRVGDVMKESVQAALSYVRAHANELGIYSKMFKRYDAHIHFPEGAVPKDGPSAGVTLVTAIASAFSGIAVRKRVAMTGEVTLRGNVLQIGGLKEKLLAAKRGGALEVLIPAENEKDLVEIPKEITNGLKIHLLSHATDYLKHALETTAKPVSDPPEPKEPSTAESTRTGGDAEIIQPPPANLPTTPSVYT